MRDSDIDSLSADGAQEPAPSPAADITCLVCGDRLRLEDLTGHLYSEGTMPPWERAAAESWNDGYAAGYRAGLVVAAAEGPTGPEPPPDEG